MSQTYTNAALGTILEIRDITQGQLEQWMAGMRKFKKAEESTPEYHGSILRAAVEAGVIAEPALTVESVANLDPRKARWYAFRLNDYFVEITTIPPD